MVSFAISSLAFTNDYSQLRFEMDKLFSIENANVLDTAEYHNPVIVDGTFLDLDLKENFTFRETDTVNLPADIFEVQKCPIDIILSATLNADVQKLPPVSAFTYTEDDEWLMIDSSSALSSYNL